MTGSQPHDGLVDGPIAARMLVGAQLRRLREGQNISRAEAGHLIRASESKISRLELGRVGFKERDVTDLLTLYGVQDGAEREAMLARIRDTNTASWWHPYSDVMPNWFHRYLGLEATAELIRTYEVQFVPGLLQTEDYARAVVRLRPGSQQDEDVERRVRVRLERQRQVLDQPDPPRLWAVVDEAALRRPVGGREVMRDQLEKLVAVVTKDPGVRLQIIPLAAGGHAATGGAFTTLRFPNQQLPDLVYIEQLTSAHYIERREEVEQYAEALSRLFIEAEPPDRTTEILDRIIHDLGAAGR